ncbi:MAG: hypothetical protein ACRD1P_01690, partial [Thermoanaerobaculia bacterium]
MATESAAGELATKLKNMGDEQKKVEKVTISFAQLEDFGEACGTKACEVYVAGLKEDARKGIFPDIDEVKKKVAELNKIPEQLKSIQEGLAAVNVLSESARTESFGVKKAMEKLGSEVFATKDSVTKLSK